MRAWNVSSPCCCACSELHGDRTGAKENLILVDTSQEIKMWYEDFELWRCLNYVQYGNCSWALAEYRMPQSGYEDAIKTVVPFGRGVEHWATITEAFRTLSYQYPWDDYSHLTDKTGTHKAIEQAATHWVDLFESENPYWKNILLITGKPNDTEPNYTSLYMQLAGANISVVASDMLYGATYFNGSVWVDTHLIDICDESGGRYYSHRYEWDGGALENTTLKHDWCKL